MREREREIYLHSIKRFLISITRSRFVCSISRLVIQIYVLGGISLTYSPYDAYVAVLPNYYHQSIGSQHWSRQIDGSISSHFLLPSSRRLFLLQLSPLSNQVNQSALLFKLEAASNWASRFTCMKFSSLSLHLSARSNLSNFAISAKCSPLPTSVTS